MAALFCLDKPAVPSQSILCNRDSTSHVYCGGRRTVRCMVMDLASHWMDHQYWIRNMITMTVKLKLYSDIILFSRIAFRRPFDSLKLRSKKQRMSLDQGGR